MPRRPARGTDSEGTLINLCHWLAVLMPKLPWQLNQPAERRLLSCLEERLMAPSPALFLIGVGIFTCIFSLILGIGGIQAGEQSFCHLEGQETGDPGKGDAVTRKD